VQLMQVCDNLVEELGVSGLNPDLQKAVGRVIEARAARDMALFMARVREFEQILRRIALRENGGQQARTFIDGEKAGKLDDK
jgi:hypothetical protein